MTPSLDVSAIIPVHNGAHHVGRAFASVLDQTRLPSEVIVVDDGSIDDSAAEIAAIAESSPVPVIVVSHANVGQSASRNAAAAVASGQLLAFLDQDDLWRPRHVERLAAPFTTDPDLGWTYSDFDEIDADGLIVTRNFMRAVGADTPRTTVTDIIQRDGMVLPSASIIRASAFRQVDGFDSRLRGYEDDDLFLRVFRAGWTSRFTPESLTVFRVHANSSSTRSIFRDSRMTYFAKVAESLPDDVRLNRYYVSDLLRPRMLNSTLFEYSVALNLGHHDEARSIAATLSTLLESAAPGRRRHAALFVLRRPRLARFLLGIHARVPRRLRPRIPPVLAPR